MAVSPEQLELTSAMSSGLSPHVAVVRVAAMTSVSVLPVVPLLTYY